MRDMSIFWLRVAVVLYSAGLMDAVWNAIRRDARIFPTAMGAFRVGVVIHMVAIVELWFGLGHVPADNFYESMSLCGFFLAVVFLFVEWRYRFNSLGVAFFPLVFLMTLVGATELPVAGWQDPAVRGLWLTVHVLLILSGYAALALTAVAALFYLVQERRLKLKKTGAISDRLPPLATLDNLITRAMGTGFLLITLGLVAGSTWAFIESGTGWITDPKIAVSMATWLFYLIMVFLRTSAGWRGRKAAVMALCVVGCSALTWAAHVGLRPLLETR